MEGRKLSSGRERAGGNCPVEVWAEAGAEARAIKITQRESVWPNDSSHVADRGGKATDGTSGRGGGNCI